MAVDYGMSIGLNSIDLVLALLAVQFISFPAAIGYGFLGNRIGTKRAILTAIAVYLFVSVFAAFMETRNGFYFLAVIIGLVQGGIQSLSRSFYARIIPVDKAAEYFGFYNMLGKFAVVIGPVLIGGVGLFVRSLGYHSDLASRISIVSVSLLFIAGAVFLCFVNEDKAKEELKHL